MPGPIAGYRVVAQAASADLDMLFDPAATRSLIEMLEATRAVSQYDDAYVVDRRSLQLIAPQYEQLIYAAVTRASCEPMLRPVAQAMDADEWLRKLDEIVAALRLSQELVGYVRQLFDAADADVFWWGVRVNLAPEGAAALMSILRLDARQCLVLLAPFAPKLAAVVFVADAAGKALAQWIRDADQGAGVRLELLMWIVPWVESRE